jgi:hypothetical protein
MSIYTVFRYLAIEFELKTLNTGSRSTSAAVAVSISQGGKAFRSQGLLSRSCSLEDVCLFVIEHPALWNCDVYLDGDP